MGGFALDGEEIPVNNWVPPSCELNYRREAQQTGALLPACVGAVGRTYTETDQLLSPIGRYKSESHRGICL